MDRKLLRHVQSLYARVPLRDRAHVAARLALCPFERLAPFVPRTGQIVDLGCGHGVFAHALALEAPGRHVVGLDPSAHKLSMARSAAHGVRFVRGDARSNPISGPCQAILLIDVLYLLNRTEQERVLCDCHHRLSPGGVLLIKTVDDRPRWKAAVNHLEEWLVVRLLGVTLCEGKKFAFRSLSEWAALCGAIGFDARAVRLDRGTIHPHGAVVGVRR
jgi:SAM-dependent methyltransferase